MSPVPDESSLHIDGRLVGVTGCKLLNSGYLLLLLTCIGAFCRVPASWFCILRKRMLRLLVINTLWFDTIRCIQPAIDFIRISTSWYCRDPLNPVTVFPVGRLRLGRQSLSFPARYTRCTAKIGYWCISPHVTAISVAHRRCDNRAGPLRGS